jgi:hypothetical protein
LDAATLTGDWASAYDPADDDASIDPPADPAAEEAGCGERGDGELPAVDGAAWNWRRNDSSCGMNT